MLAAVVVGLGAGTAHGAVTGVVYNDHNSNGVRDLGGAVGTAVDGGVAGVSVLARASSGATFGPALTGATGAYSLPVPDGTAVRIEFDSLPAGFESGRQGPASGTSVQFATAPAAGVSLGVLRPGDYCQDNPMLAVACWAAGNAGGTEASAGAFSTLRTFPYANAGELDGNVAGPGPSATRPGPNDAATLAQIGTTYGAAWNPAVRTLYLGAYLRRKAPFGPSGPGAIYAVRNPTAGGDVSTFVDLEALFPGAGGPNPHPAGTDWNRDEATTNLVGKRSLGDVELSADGATLYAVSLADRQLYAIPTSGTPTAATIRRTDIAAARPASCATDGDFRPMGLGLDRRGNLLVGAVCTGEAAAQASQLRMYVMRFSGGLFTTVLDAPVVRDSQPWKAWTADDASSEHPEPLVADIVEDETGALSIGIRDRYGDKTPAADKTPAEDPFPRGLGDIVRACPSGSGYVLEQNGTCGGVTTAGAVPAGAAGGGEYYYQDRAGDDAPESVMGALAYVPGYTDVMATAYDAVSTGATNVYADHARNIYSNGVQRHGIGDGQQEGAYDVVVDATPARFGKANGLGDLEALCDAAPLEVGNRLWVDIDGDGLQDAGEPAIAGVTVELRSAAGAVLATTTTSAAGTYAFPVAPTSAYSVAVELNQPPLAPYVPTAPNAGGALVLDSNGVRSGTRVETRVTTGGAGRSDHTVDFGFVPVAAYDILKEVFDPVTKAWFDADRGAGTRGTNDGVPVQLTPGATAQYRITVTNTGRVPLTAVRVTDAWCGLDRTLAQIPVGRSSELTCERAKVTASKVNTATVASVTPTLADGHPLPGLPPRSEDAAIVIVSAGATGRPGAPRSKLAIVKVGPARAIASQQVSYAITVRVANGAATTARNVRVIDLLPSGLRIVAAQQLERGVSVGLARGRVAIRLGNIASGTAKTVRLVFRVTDGARGRLTNVAHAEADNAPRVSASAVTVVTPKPKPAAAGVTG